MNLFDALKNACIKQGNKDKILPSLIFSQLILESGLRPNKEHLSTLADPPNYNLFGIKGSYNGKSVTLKTAEYTKSGVKYYVNANFRKYNSYEESIHDHNQLFINGLSWNHDFYKSVLGEKDFLKAAKSLTGKYATDPNYDKKLSGIYTTYNLKEMDKGFLETAKPKPIIKPVPKPEHVYYKVKSGDTVSEIALKYHTTKENIKKLNGLDVNYTIYAGKTIRIK